MRHCKFSQRLSRPTGPRRSLLRNMVINLLKYQRVKTTKAKAKQTQAFAERLICLGKQGGLSSRRQALKMLADKTTVNHLFSKIAPLFKQRPSGFSRIMHYGPRKGDGAALVFLELTEKLPKEKPKVIKKEKALSEKQVEAEKAKPKPEAEPTRKAQPPKEKRIPPKKLKPKKFLGGLRKLFKRERDSL